ncbi:MAG: hypothetical protein ABI299_07800 [Rhodanobacter sp.]
MLWQRAPALALDLVWHADSKLLENLTVVPMHERRVCLHET